MGKGHRHKKNLKSEKAKVKLKTKTKQLPKGLNVTDTSFKVKKILIRDQLKTQTETELVSRRNLNIKDLITRLHHYNSSVRQEAVKGLKDILLKYSSQIVSSEFYTLLRGISALSLDKEKSVRRDSFKALSLILNSVSDDQLEPFFDILISYLSCAMTHIDPNIKEDSLLFLDVIAENCGLSLAKNSHKILPNFLDMISKLRTESKLDRQLVTTLNSKQTSIKWRINVLSRLSNILMSMINVKKLKQLNGDSSFNSKIIYNAEKVSHIPLFRLNYLKIRSLNFTKTQDLNVQIDGSSDEEKLKQFIQVLMMLMIESWIEVAPKQNGVAESNHIISNETASLLNTIMEIMELLIEYIDMFESDLGINTIGVWFNDNFRTMFEKNIVDNFPYCSTKTFTKVKKRQADFSLVHLNTKCLEQNLALCHIYIWLSSRNFTKGNAHFTKDTPQRVLQYINEQIEDWSSADNSALPQLIRSIKCLLLRASKVWYHNKIHLGATLRAIIDVQSQYSKKELKSQLFAILNSVIMDHNLTELHREPEFKDFITSLPNFLLKRSIEDDTIKILSKVVLQHKKWIAEILRNKQKEIIENAEKIEIIGSEDEKRSRLSICNLFYFINGQVYY